MITELNILQVGQVNWQPLIDSCVKHLGHSPTRGLDDCHIDIKHPSALLHTLDLWNDPKRTIKRRELYGHIFISFVAFADDIADILNLTAVLPIKISSYPSANDKGYILIMSATLADWDYAILTFCIRAEITPVRKVLNGVKILLERAGYNEIWADYEELPIADGTFALWRKG
jgi:hypothetical protein